MADLEIEDTTKYQKYIYRTLQDKNWCLASEALTYS